MSEALLPCPCCGGIPAIAGIVTSTGLVWRLLLGKGQHEDARKAWNRRIKDAESKND